MAVAGIFLAFALVGPAEGSTGLATYDRALSPRLSGWEDARLVRREGEPALAFAARATQAVSDAVYHCDPNEPQSWLAALAPHPEGMLNPENLRCGFCSQVSFVLAESLSRGGIEAEAWGLDGHIVTTFTDAGQTYVADADFGIAPFAVDWSDPASLEAEVRARYPINDAAHMQRVVDIFTDTSSDGPYWTMPELRAMAAEQRRVMALELPLAALLIVTAILLLSRSRSRRTSGKYRWSLG